VICDQAGEDEDRLGLLHQGLQEEVPRKGETRVPSKLGFVFGHRDTEPATRRWPVHLRWTSLGLLKTTACSSRWLSRNMQPHCPGQVPQAVVLHNWNKSAIACQDLLRRIVIVGGARRKWGEQCTERTNRLCRAGSGAGA
jgi:hypothetical protein